MNADGRMPASRRLVFILIAVALALIVIVAIVVPAIAGGVDASVTVR